MMASSTESYDEAKAKQLWGASLELAQLESEKCVLQMQCMIYCIASLAKGDLDRNAGSVGSVR